MYKLWLRDKAIKPDSEMVQVLELGDKHFKATIINMFKDLKEKVLVNNRLRNLSREMKAI